MNFFGWLNHSVHDDVQVPAFDDPSINPSTGLPMMEGGGVDVGGNLFGDSSSYSMSLNNSQDIIGADDLFGSEV